MLYGSRWLNRMYELKRFLYSRNSFVSPKYTRAFSQRSFSNDKRGVYSRYSLYLFKLEKRL